MACQVSDKVFHKEQYRISFGINQDLGRGCRTSHSATIHFCLYGEE